MEKHIILDDPDNYPLRVAFLGKKGLLSQTEIEFLIQHGVDFDVDESQVAHLYAVSRESEAAARAEERRPALAASRSTVSGAALAPKRSSHRLLIGCLLALLAAALAGLAALLRIIQALGARKRR